VWLFWSWVAWCCSDLLVGVDSTVYVLLFSKMFLLGLLSLIDKMLYIFAIVLLLIAKLRIIKLLLMTPKRQLKLILNMPKPMVGWGKSQFLYSIIKWNPWIPNLPKERD